MRLLRHEVCGFLYFEKPLIIDYRELPDGLLAVWGGNGEGKTGLVVNAPFAALYGPGDRTKRDFPSYPPGYTLADFAKSRSAYIDDLWEVPGRGVYRIRVNVDGDARNTDATIEEVQSNGSRRVLNTDGLLATYRRYVDEVFPSRLNVLASRCGTKSNTGSFDSLDQVDRMRLFAEMIGLGQYEAWSAACARNSKHASTAADTLRTAITVMRQTCTPEAEAGLRTDYAGGQEEQRRRQSERAAVQSEYERLAQTRPTVAARAKAHAEAAARLVEVERAVATAKRVLETAVSDNTARARTEMAARAAIDVRLSATLASLATKEAAAHADSEKVIRDRESRIRSNRTLLESAHDVADAMSQDAAARAEIAELRDSIEQDRIAESLTRDHVRAKQGRLRAVAPASAMLTDARTKAATLPQVKVGPICVEDPACPFVTDAVNARTLIPFLEAQVEEATVLTSDIAADESVLATLQERIADATATIAKREAAITGRLAVTSRAPLLDRAAEYLATHEHEIAEAREKAGRRRAEYEQDCVEARAAIASELIAHDARVAEDQQSATARIEGLRADVASAVASRDTVHAAIEEYATAPDELEDLDHALKVASEALSTMDARLAALTERLQGIASSLADLTQRRARVEMIAARLTEAENEHLAWQFLAKGCGRDGLQKLEVDAAGPEVSDLATRLLRIGWGTRYGLKVTTQVPNKAGDALREQFTVMVIDNHHGGAERDFALLSDGEKVVAREAISSGAVCYAVNRSGGGGTILRDEADGAIQENHAPQYVAMLRRLQEESKAAQVVYVTHRKECARLADAIIAIKDGQATVLYPPYGDLSHAA